MIFTCASCFVNEGLLISQGCETLVNTKYNSFFIKENSIPPKFGSRRPCSTCTTQNYSQIADKNTRFEVGLAFFRGRVKTVVIGIFKYATYSILSYFHFNEVG